MTKIYAVT